MLTPASVPNSYKKDNREYQASARVTACAIAARLGGSRGSQSKANEPRVCTVLTKSNTLDTTYTHAVVVMTTSENSSLEIATVAKTAMSADITIVVAMNVSGLPFVKHTERGKRVVWGGGVGT